MPTFYHFTSRLYLPTILRKGIQKGDVATSPDMGFNAPWLTTNADYNAQGWCRSSFLDKTEVRLSVEIPDNDPNLWTWAKLIKEYEMDEFWVEALSIKIGQNPSHWFIYMGGISPMRITEIRERQGLQPFDRQAYIDTLPDQFAHLTHEGPLGEVVPCTRKATTKEDFLESLGAELLPPAPRIGVWGVGKSHA
ncbi:hypothetical protein N9917_00875 [Deltaproteobacteria bacterium]|nr:hypothetical protein [Deltaproteobacteria bacterium]